MQTQTVAQTMPAVLPTNVDLDVVSTPEKARTWLRICDHNPKLAEGCMELFLAAQLTLLGIGEEPQLVW